MGQQHRRIICCATEYLLGNPISNMRSVHQRNEFMMTEVFSVTCILAKSLNPVAKWDASNEVISKVTTKWLGMDSYYTSTLGCGHAEGWHIVNSPGGWNFMLIKRKQYHICPVEQSFYCWKNTVYLQPNTEYAWKRQGLHYNFCYWWDFDDSVLGIQIHDHTTVLWITIGTK